MYVYELNTMNIDFVKPCDPDKLYNNAYTPRDEVAHPLKIRALAQQHDEGEHINNGIWSLYILNNVHPYFTCKINWDATYESYGVLCKASHFRVLCKTPSMFNIMHDIHNIDHGSLHYWLSIHHDSLLLISHVVYEHPDKATNNMNYCCVEDGTLLLDSTNMDDEMLQLISNKAYTIGNGITLLLALHRAGLIRCELLLPVLKSFLKTHRVYFQPINEDWQELYYAPKTPLIADFPYLYACFGPNFVHVDMLKMLNKHNMASDNVMMQSYQGEFCLMTRQTAMFPHFNLEHWKTHEAIKSWSTVYKNIPSTTVYVLNGLGNITTEYHSHTMYDFVGMLSSFVHDDAYAYWENVLVHTSFMKDIFDVKDVVQSHKRKILHAFLKSCFHIHKYGIGHTNAHVTQQRIRSMWYYVMTQFYSKDDLQTCIATLCIFFKTAPNLVDYETIPNEFVQDVFKLSKQNKIDLCCTKKYTGIVNNFMAMRIKQDFPHVVFKDSHQLVTNYKRFNLNTSIYALLLSHDSIKSYVHQKITTNLLHLKHICNCSDMSSHVIYDLVIDYIKTTANNNKILLLA